MPPPTLLIQTTYAELLERCAANAFVGAFPEKGAFVAKEIRGKRYWYFQLSSESGRVQRYVGPETPELLDRISHHREARADQRERTALVSALVRQGMPRPQPEMGDIVAALATAGAFRLGCVLVGTIAYQTYSAILGTKLPNPLLQTGDVDIAQFASRSRKVADQLVDSVLGVLQQADATFRPVPSLAKSHAATSYQNVAGRVRVDLLTPNEGPDTDEPQLLPALRSHAQPLRFLDFLIHQAQPAVMLHRAGVYVNVPEPQRYAIHKLIIAQRRSGAAVKRDKDIAQADALLTILAKRQPDDVATAWREAADRGKTWRDLLVSGMKQLPQMSRDLTLKVVEQPRSIIPGLDLTFQNPAPRYEFDRDVVFFVGQANGEAVRCAISGEALEDHFAAGGSSSESRIAGFLNNRSAIEQIARLKYLSRPVEEPGSALIRSSEIPGLVRESPKSAKRLK